MEYIQEITLDLNADSVPVLVSAKQADELSRKLKIYLMSDGNEYQPEPDAMVLVRARKPDGTYFVDAAIASIHSNIVEVTLSSDALSAAGRALVDIVLYNGSQYLSTASFILKIQPSPSEVMSMAVPTDGNDYPVFLTLMSALGSIEPLVQSAAAEAVAASDSAWAAVNNFSLTAGSAMQPGKDPSVTGIAPAYTLRLPSVKPMAAITINETGVAASATVTVEDFPAGASVPAGLNSDLIKVFNFGITLPSGRNVQIDDTLEQPGQAADASAVGTALAAKYDSSSSIPLANIGISSASPLSIENGGTGASNAIGARTNIGAQRAIQASDVSISYNDWSGTQTVRKTITNPNGIPISGVPNFVASPAGPTSWQAAMDIGLYPPIGSYTSGNTWDLTWTCEESVPSTISDIDITVYWW